MASNFAGFVLFKAGVCDFECTIGINLHVCYKYKTGCMTKTELKDWNTGLKIDAFCVDSSSKLIDKINNNIIHCHIFKIHIY